MHTLTKQQNFDIIKQILLEAKEHTARLTEHYHFTLDQSVGEFVTEIRRLLSRFPKNGWENLIHTHIWISPGSPVETLYFYVNCLDGSACVTYKFLVNLLEGDKPLSFAGDFEVLNNLIVVAQRMVDRSQKIAINFSNAAKEITKC